MTVGSPESSEAFCATGVNPSRRSSDRCGGDGPSVDRRGPRRPLFGRIRLTGQPNPALARVSNDPGRKRVEGGERVRSPPSWRLHR
ncbi:hypothetical protein B005_0367 [Nocardiopsis alba ATCC BAA-2165]|uniref:Uncharacterized protein n=1 Tax=Nocardiopsis alba (strain ATCC BAA-2165 / BE74) TaxID=1205910 RepID=J7LCM2_NOCAA|nr:hypothetical protein B005_0367 [Nocardiopsis alba ATCC BAA-2165]